MFRTYEFFASRFEKAVASVTGELSADGLAIGLAAGEPVIALGDACGEATGEATGELTPDVVAVDVPPEVVDVVLVPLDDEPPQAAATSIAASAAMPAARKTVSLMILNLPTYT